MCVRGVDENKQAESETVLMGRKCSVCTHPQRESIDRAIVEGQSNRAIARQYGLSKDAVARHAEKHLPAALVEVAAASESTHVDDLWTRVSRLILEADELQRHGRRAKDARAWAAGIREARSCLELLAKIGAARMLGQRDAEDDAGDLEVARAVLRANPDNLRRLRRRIEQLDTEPLDGRARR